MRHRIAQATYPSSTRAASYELLFGLAPSGVYRATFITKRAVRSYRTLSPLPICIGGLLSVALAVGSRRPGVTWHSALWSPDFPRLGASALVWLTRGGV